MYSIQINLHLQICTRDDPNEQEFAVEKKICVRSIAIKFQRILNDFKRGCIWIRFSRNILFFHEKKLHSLCMDEIISR